MAGAGGNAIGNNRLICCDVVRGHVLDRDLLLASASVVVEPFGQHHHRSRGLVRKLQMQHRLPRHVIRSEVDIALVLVFALIACDSTERLVSKHIVPPYRVGRFPHSVKSRDGNIRPSAGCWSSSKVRDLDISGDRGTSKLSADIAAPVVTIPISEAQGDKVICANGLITVRARHRAGTAIS
jgi:hypothetical protein